MQCSAKVLQTKITSDGEMLAKLQFNGRLPKEGDIVKCKWGKVRSKNQNSIYWLLLTFYTENGMQDMGYMTKEELHEAMKGRFLMKKIEDDNGIVSYQAGSTTDLKTDEFMEYIQKIEHCLLEYCNVSSSGFWKTYGENYGK